MKSYFEAFFGKIDEEFLRKHIWALTQKEYKQTFEANHAGIDYVCNLMKENGLDAERINFVADGKTTCYDNFMPLAWDVSYARLSVVSDDWDGERVVADYEKEPFSIIRYSVPTGEEGITARLFTWEQMMSGENVEGAFVTVCKDKLPNEGVLGTILDRGAIGLVNGTNWDPNFPRDPRNQQELYDAVFWANDCSETYSWNVNDGERDFIGFSVSPRTLDKLEQACNRGEVIIKAETDAHRYAGELPATTALIKGESDREFWIMAHSSEPLEDDNNSGVIMSVQAAIAIKKALEEGTIPPLKYSIRLIFAPERYGFAAFADKYGPSLREHCIGAMCVDGVPNIGHTDDAKIMFSLPEVPFYGNVIMEAMWDYHRQIVKKPPFVSSWMEYYGSDTFLNDASVGLPTMTAFAGSRYLWHCSLQRKYEYIDYAYTTRVTAVFASIFAAICACDSKKFEEFLPTAASYAIARIAHLASTKPKRPGSDARDRVMHRAEIEKSKIQAFKDAGVNEKAIKKACKTIEKFAKTVAVTQADAKTGPTPVLDLAKGIIPKRNSIGVPHDFTRAPLGDRLHIPHLQFLHNAFSAMDGKKTLKDIIIQKEYEIDVCWTEQEVQSFIDTMNYLAKYEYIKIK